MLTRIMPEARTIFLPVVACTRCGARRVAEWGVSMRFTVCHARDERGEVCANLGVALVALGEEAEA